MLIAALASLATALAATPATTRTPDIARWESFRFGAFVHYNMNTYGPENGPLNDYYGGDCHDADLFAPTRLDVRSWVRAFKDSGMGYAVLTTRHVGGFLLWDSATSQYTAPRSTAARHRDLVAEFVAECRRQGLGVGLYYLIGGGPGDTSSCPVNGHPFDTSTLKAQLTELASSYGPIDLFWLDMMDWRAPSEVSAQELYDLIKSRQPHASVHFNQHAQDGSHLHYFPTDVVNGEETLPPATGYLASDNALATAARDAGERAYDDNASYRQHAFYLPYEYALTSQVSPDERPTTPVGAFHNTLWFTRRSTRAEDARLVYAGAREAYARGAANVLLAAAPDQSGSMRARDAEQLRILGSLIGSGASLALEPESLVRKVESLGELTSGGAARCRFRVGPEPLEVTALSRFRALGNAGAAVLELAEAGTQKTLGSTRLELSATRPDWNGFDHASLASPVRLEAGKDYELTSRPLHPRMALSFHASSRVTTDALIETDGRCEGPLSLVAHPVRQAARAARGRWNLSRGDATGCVPDGSARANPVCPHAGARITPSGMTFDGTQSYARLEHSGALASGRGGLAIEAVFRPDRLDGLRNIVAHGYTVSPAREVFLRLNAGHYEFGTWDGVSTIAAHATVARAAMDSHDAGHWVTLTGRFDGTRWQLFRAGRKIAETRSTQVPADVPADWAIGGCARGLCAGGETRGFAGVISRVRISAE